VPTTLTIIAIVATVASTAVAVSGQMAAGAAADKAAKYNAQVAQNNAQAARDQGAFESQVAQNDATAAQNAAKIREDILRRQGAQVQSEGVALAGAAGVDPGEGSPLLVTMQNKREIEIAAQREKYAGQIEANAALSRGTSAQYASDLAATGYESSARLQRFSGRIAQQSSYTQAGTTLLSGAGTVAKQYGDYYMLTAKK
jgi:hypothetical protein